MNNSDAALPPLLDSTSAGIFMFVNTLIAVCGTCGNGLVIASFFISKIIRTTKYNFFLLSLAFADLLACLICIPLWNFVLYKESLPTPPLSLAELEDTASTDHTMNIYEAYHSYLDPLFGVASIMNLLAVSVVRCLAIHFPVKYSNIPEWVFGIVAFIFPWGVGFLSLIYLNEVDPFWEEKMVVLICIIYFVPLLLIIIAYGLIFKGVGITRINNNAEDVSKHVVMIGILVTCFVIAWAPFFALTIVVVHCKECPVHFIGVCVIKTLQYSNSFVNVFIYAWQCKDFREAFRRIFRFLSSSCDRKNGRQEMDPAWKDMGLSTASIAPVMSVEI